MMQNIQTPDASPGQSALAQVPRYGSKRDVAAMVQMSVRSVDNFVAAGCPHLRVSSRRLRFDMGEVRAWLADNFRTQRPGGCQMKAAADYKSADEILHDDEIPSTYHRAKLLDEFRARHAGDVVPAPVASAEQLIQLRNARASLASLAIEFTAQDAREKVAAEFVPAAREKLDVLKRATNFDAPGDNIFALLVHERRLAIALEFLNNLPARRELLTRQLIGAFGSLNHTLEPLAKNHFFVNGTKPEQTIPDALAAIDALLK
jgi:hypothetical protein